MPHVHGVIVYEILPDGCLNGVYSNDWHGNPGPIEIYNEIARKQIGEDRTEIAGRYDCFYFDVLNAPNNCMLNIDARVSVPNRGHYQFEWQDSGGTLIFRGSGWKTRDNQITVRYDNI